MAPEPTTPPPLSPQPPAAAAVDACESLPTSVDRLFRGRLVFEQPAAGYRAAIDGLLLAAFAGRAQRAAVDLGAGAGMVSLALLAREAAPLLVAVERDEAVAALLRRNIEANGLASRATVVVSDVEACAQARRGSADLVVANPPFWSEAHATPAQSAGARAARVGPGSDGALPAFVRAARALLARGGRACFVWPAADLAALLDAARASGLHAKRMRFVHPLPDRAASRVLTELKAGRAGGLLVEPPLMLCDRPGEPSPEAAAISAGER